jgi:hypothetical protein
LRADRRGFGWGWLALCVACLVLLVWLLVHNAPVERKDVQTRTSTESGREPATPILPDADADPPVAPLTAAKPTPQSADSTTDPALSNGASSRKTPLAANSRVPLGLPSLSIGKIEPTLVKSPSYMLANGQAKIFTPRRWLRVVVTFNSASARIGELLFRYKISIGDESFTGTFTHVDILGNGEHQVAAFLIPSAVEPLVQRRDFIADKNVTVEVEALNGETVLSRSTFGRMPVASRNVRSGLLRSVEETPFAPLEVDSYERTAP